MSIGKAIMARTAEERAMWEGIEEARMWASRAMLCPSGRVLDVSTVMVFEVPGAVAGTTVPIAFHKDVADTIREGLTNAGVPIVIVCDGPALDEQRRAFERARRAERAAAKATQAKPQD